MMISIRPAEEKDLPAILEIYNDVIVNTTAVYDYLPHTLEMRREWYAARQKDNYPVFVAEEGQKLLGFSSYGPFRAWAAYKHTVENAVYVSSAARGRGIGKLLMAPLIDTAKERGLHAMVAGIDSTNEASIRLHLSLGFEEVGHFREVGHKFDRWLDLVFLELILG
jgi:L-amino acid N-acyltransferase YncA